MSKNLTKSILQALYGRNAHVVLDDVLDRVPKSLRNAPIAGLPYTLWGLLEHIRRAQRDILEYMVNPNYEVGAFPEDYWPQPGVRMHWDRTVVGYREDLKEIRALISTVDVFDQLPYGKSGHTYLREVLILADHHAYHLGQMVLLLRLKGVWNGSGLTL